MCALYVETEDCSHLHIFQAKNFLVEPLLFYEGYNNYIYSNSTNQMLQLSRIILCTDPPCSLHAIGLHARPVDILTIYIAHFETMQSL